MFIDLWLWIKAVCWFYLGSRRIIRSSKFNPVVHAAITTVSSTGGCVHRGLNLLLSVVLFVAMVPAEIVTPKRATNSQRVNAQARNVITYVYLGNLLDVCIFRHLPHPLPWTLCVFALLCTVQQNVDVWQCVQKWYSVIVLFVLEKECIISCVFPHPPILLYALFLKNSKRPIPVIC